jgi:hypothetical protein
VMPSVGVSYKPSAAFNVGLTYNPDFVWYHSQSSEDYIAQRGSLNLSGKTDTTSWESLNSLSWIDGSHLGPTFDQTAGGDVPAIGGIPLRDRRDQGVYRNSLKLTQTLGQWMLRPVFNSYVHDFMTEQRPYPAQPSANFYENYIDRYDLSGGLDVGYEAFKNTRLVAGYRFGHQHQGTLVGTPSAYSNDYNRFLVGVEGSPASWVKLSLLGGPDIRHFGHGVSPSFDRNEMLYFVDASIAFLPSQQDTVTLLNRRYEQPAFSSQSMYEDIIYSVSWKHKFSDHWAGSLGFQLYIGDWQAPVNREDRIYTPSASLAYTLDKHLSAEVTYAYDWVDQQVPLTTVAWAKGREWTRHLVTLGLRYSF